VRFILDTNIWVSALVWGGQPLALLKMAATPPHQIHISNALLSELKNTLHYPKIAPYLHQRGLVAQELYQQVALMVHLQTSPALAKPLCRDPDDDAVLACALAAQADLIVSGDQDLLVLHVFEGIPIVTAAQALERLKG
jgi:uncharacterized protein